MLARRKSNRTDILLLLIPLSAAVFLVFAGGVAKLVVVSALLAYILDPLVNGLESRCLSRTLATIIVVLAIFALVILTVTVLLPLVYDQLKGMQESSAPGQDVVAFERLETLVKTKLGFLGTQDFSLAQKIQQGKLYVSEKLIEFLLTDSISLIIHMVTIPFAIFFLLKDGREMKKHFIKLVPNRYFEFSMDLFYKMDQQLGYYLRGQFMDAVTFGTLTTIALWLLGVKYFIFIGVFAGMANLIPYVGPIAGVLPAITVAVLDSGDIMRGAYVLIAFLCLKLIDDSLIQPMVVARSVDLHPLLVLLVIIVGGHLFGILGMLIAVPCTGFLKVLFKESAVTFRKYRFN